MSAPTELDQFVRELQDFTRPSAWGRCRAALRRLWGRHRERPETFRAGDVVDINGTRDVVISARGDTVTLRSGGTITMS